MPSRSVPRHAVRSTRPTGLGLLTGSSVTASKRLPAEPRSLRGAMWAALGAVVFVAMSHPSILQGHWLTTLRWACIVTGVVAVVDCRAFRLPRVNALVLAFLCFCLLTGFWSPDPEATVAAVAVYAAVALLAATLVENMTGGLLVRSMAMGAVLVMLLSLWAVWSGHPSAVGPSGDHTVLQGLYGNRNIMSYVMVLGLAGLLADRYRGRTGWLLKWALVMVALVMLFFVRSGTGTIAASALVCLAVVGALVRLVPPRHVRKVAIGAASLGVVLVGVAAASFGQVVAILGKDSSFSGRTPLWAGIIDVWTDAVPGGFGWGSVWAYSWFEIEDSAVRDRINTFVGYPLNHGHNAVLDILVQVGLVGTIIYLAIVVLAIVRGLRGAVRASGPDRTWVLLVLSAVCIGGLTEPLFAAPIGWFLVVAASCAAARLRSAPDRGL